MIYTTKRHLTLFNFVKNKDLIFLQTTLNAVILTIFIFKKDKYINCPKE
ncbi:hypothetical protein RCH19_000351 [Flavobacterium sp. PL12]